MSDLQFPDLDNKAIAATRSAMHAYARVLGNCLKAMRSKRKHWWHASLRPSLNGLGTGVVRAPDDFELELDFRHAKLHARTRSDSGFDLQLNGQAASEISEAVRELMAVNGAEDAQIEQFVVANAAAAADS